MKTRVKVSILIFLLINILWFFGVYLSGHPFMRSDFMAQHYGLSIFVSVSASILMYVIPFDYKDD